METHKTPNKYNIFQQYYLRKNGEKLSYNEAVRLFYKMDAIDKDEFKEFYEDRVGYEVTDDLNPYTTNNGLNAKRKLRDVKPVFDEEGNKKTKPVKKKVLQSDGTLKYEQSTETVWEHNSTAVTQNALYTTYNAKSHALICGIKPENSNWLIYSAEEILQMQDEGVNIPQDVIDYAHTILETSGSTYSTNVEDEGGNEADKTTEREAFLELIPKTEKHIEKCQDKQEKIDEKIEDMLNQNKNERKSLFEKQKSQLEQLEEYEEKLREWRRLQDKINNGEELTDSEARKYADITGMLEDRNNSDDFKFNKNKIAMSLNEINILSALGEKLAGETIEMGETLADYTSAYNYKSTKNTVTGEVGFLRAIIAMVTGKAVAKEAVQVGTETKTFTEDTSQTINDIAQILGVESMIANPPAGESEATNEPSDAKVAENEVQMGTNDDKSDIHKNTEKAERTDSAEKKNTTQEDDFLINDDNVLQLIDEAGEIHTDLTGEIKNAVLAVSDAKSDKEYVKQIEKVVDNLVKEYMEEESKRQEIIKAKEQENKEAQDRIEELGGFVDAADDNKQIEAERQIIVQNNKDIEQLQQEKETAVTKFKSDTKDYKQQITESVPNEMSNLKRDTEYRDDIIPEYSERLSFTESSGNTLNKMGKYRVKLGQEMIAQAFLSPHLYKLGMHHIEMGTKSTQIGVEARQIGELPTDEQAAKITEISTEEESLSLDDLNAVDSKISSVTGEETEAEKAQNVEEDTEGEEQSEGVEGEGGEGNDAKNPQGEGQPEGIEPTVAGVAANMTINVNGVNAVSNEGNSVSKEAVSNNKENKAEIKDEKTPINEMSTESTTKSDAVSAEGTGKKKKEKKEMSTDDAGSSVKDITRSAKDTANDSEHVKKDTEKDEKQLDKEAKRLQKQMKKDEKDIIRMTKESLRAAKKQTEILAKYEELVTENDELVAQEKQKQVSAPSQIAAPQETSMAASTIAQPTDSSQGSSADNAEKLQENDAQIAVLNTQFNMHGNKITRNRTKITKLQKSTKVNNKKFSAKIKVKNQKNKESEKKEVEKQQKLAKQLGTVGIAENVFSITQATGAAMMLFPPTEAAGAVLFKIGTYGIIACGVAKAGINFANGNTTAALMGLGQTAISAAAAMTGTGAAAGGVMGAVTSGLQVVASSAELVNNVRAVQGKEASGVFSKIGTIAGIASSVATAGSGLSNLKGASFAQAASAIGTAAGTTLSAASQIMSEFNLGDQDLAQLFGTVGGAVSMASGLASMMTAKKNKVDEKNNNNQEKENIKNNTDNSNTDNNTSSKDTKNTDSKTNDDKKTDNKSADDKVKPEQSTSESNKSDSQNAKENKSGSAKEQKNKNKWEQFMNGASYSETFGAKQDVSANFVEQIPQIITNQTNANNNKMDILKHQNVNNAENPTILENLKEAQPVSPVKINEQMKAELDAKISSPEMQDKLKEVSERIQREQLAAYQNEQAKQKRNEKASEILNAIGAVTQTVPTVLEMFGSDDDTEEIKRAYASSGKEYLTGHHTFHSEQVKEDYRKKAKKQIRRVNALSGARNVR